jgi:hypothetical protein
MQKLYFHLHECGETVIDEEGTEVDSLEEARVVALRAARSIMGSEVAAGKLCLSCHISVESAHGMIVMTVPFREALNISGL